MMSTLTTVLGLAPLALIPGEGAELRVPLAVPVIGGLIISTVLTLVVVPVLYRMIEVRGERRRIAELEVAETASPPRPRDPVPEPVSVGAGAG